MLGDQSSLPPEFQKAVYVLIAIVGLLMAVLASLIVVLLLAFHPIAGLAVAVTAILFAIAGIALAWVGWRGLETT